MRALPLAAMPTPATCAVGPKPAIGAGSRRGGPSFEGRSEARGHASRSVGPCLRTSWVARRAFGASTSCLCPSSRKRRRPPPQLGRARGVSLRRGGGG
eukprot:283394-Pyramimonas_sp.AAC.1